MAQGELAAAGPLGERALAIREKVLGPRHRSTGRSLHQMGALLRERGELAASRRFFERAVATLESALGSDHPRTIESRCALSEVIAMLHRQATLRSASHRRR